MNVVVCVKQVPDTDSPLEVSADGRDIERDSIAFVSNPYDEFAVEEGIRVCEQFGGDVTLLSLCSQVDVKPEKALRTYMAMGAERAIVLRDQAFVGGDSLATATVLAAAITRLSCDLILFGSQAVDDDGGAVGIQVAELLGIPHVGAVEKLTFELDRMSVELQRTVEDGIDVVAVRLPAAIACQRELNKPRYPSLKAIMRAKKRPIEVWGCRQLDLEPDQIGASGARLERIRLEKPPMRATGRLIEGEPAESVRVLVRMLREEARVI